jgi:hypothetical protein
VADWAPATLHSKLDKLAKTHDVGVALGEHVLVAVLVAAVAYYLLFGLKLSRALRAYRRLSENPDESVEWSDAKPLLVRRRRAELFAYGLSRSAKPTIAVVEGRTGAGRTSFLVLLVEELAKKKLIPVPVFAKRDGTFDVEKAAKETFTARIDRKVSSDQQADAIWRRARASGAVVILVDGIDDEIVEKLSADGGSRFRRALSALGDQRITVVLATTRKLPLDEMADLTEDLDLFTREEAQDYVTEYMADTPEEVAKAQEARDAIGRLHDPVDESLVAPFYLDLIASFMEPLGVLPANRDLWRRAVLAKYFDGLDRGVVGSRNRSPYPDRDELALRGAAAKEVAIRVATVLKIESGELTTSYGALPERDRDALKLAGDLSLLWIGAERVGFNADDLGAYVIGRTHKTPTRLLQAMATIAGRERDKGHRRHDRYVIMALIFWHLERDPGTRAAAFNRLLSDMYQKEWTRPAVVAAAIRIATTCNLYDDAQTLHVCAQRCIDVAQGIRESEPRSWYRQELMKLVRALADWPDAKAHALLWRLATARDIDVEWPAAKALTLADNRPTDTLRRTFDETLEKASRRSCEELSRDEDEIGNDIASLAWILPALREAAEAEFTRVRDICLDTDMSPLRGEMSLAQGLKLAVVNGRSAEQNMRDIVRLLFEDGDDGKPTLRFWHARLILVQATVAYAWLNNRDDVFRAEDLDQRLKLLQKREGHPLVLRAIRLARRGLKAIPSSATDQTAITRYIWTHERAAVKWVQQGREAVARLAADTVLLSNMTYELRRTDGDAAEKVIALDGLPMCIRKCSHRQNIARGGCTCAYKLCVESKKPVTDERAPFSESFCREQMRLVSEKGPPQWVKRGSLRSRRLLEDFWDQQATFAGRYAPVESSAFRWWMPPSYDAAEAYWRTVSRWWRSRHGERGTMAL